MEYEIKLATLQDSNAMGMIHVQAIETDDFSRVMLGTSSYKAKVEFAASRNVPRLVKGHELGACQTWKAVDLDGTILGWAGLGLPASLSKDEALSIKASLALPPGRNDAACMFFASKVLGALGKRYDPKRDCKREGLMVDPNHQRKGIGRQLTQRCSEEADKLGAVTWVSARPNAAALFVREGYEVVERIECDLSEFGAEGKTTFFIMKREPGAANDPSARLELEI